MSRELQANGQPTVSNFENQKTNENQKDTNHGGGVEMPQSMLIICNKSKKFIKQEVTCEKDVKGSFEQNLEIT